MGIYGHLVISGIRERVASDRTDNSVERNGTNQAARPVPGTAHENIIALRADTGIASAAIRVYRKLMSSMRDLA